MWTPDLFSAFVDDGVLMWVDVVGEGAGRCGPEVGEKFVLGVARDDRGREFLKNGSRRGGRGDNSDGCFDNGRWEVLYWDIREWNAIDDFLELKVDVRVLGFVGGGVLELRA